MNDDQICRAGLAECSCARCQPGPYRSPITQHDPPWRRSYAVLRGKLIRYSKWTSLPLAFIGAGYIFRECWREGIRAEAIVNAHAEDCERFRDTLQKDIPGRCLDYWHHNR